MKSGSCTPSAASAASAARSSSLGGRSSTRGVVIRRLEQGPVGRAHRDSVRFSAVRHKRFGEPSAEAVRSLHVMNRAPLVLADEASVAAAYRAHGPELYRAAVRSLSDGPLAEEAVQEVFVRAWRAADRYDPLLASLRTWLFAILRNVVVDMARARAVRPQLASEALADRRRRVGHRRVRSGARLLAGRGGPPPGERRAPSRAGRSACARASVRRGRGRSRGSGRHAQEPRVLRAEGVAPRGSKSWGGWTMSDCREWRGELAATAAGTTDPEKELAFTAHLDGCRHCRDELSELRRVASTLSLVDPERLVNPPRPPARSRVTWWLPSPRCVSGAASRRGGAACSSAGSRRRPCSRSC